MILLRGGNVYTPEKIGKRDILLAGTKIIQIIEKLPNTELEALLSSTSTLPLEIIDVTGLNVIPGLVDPHVHVTGGGGENGPASRTPEAKLHQLINAGITTVIGVLGTDSISRTLPNLLAKVRALEAEGLTTYMWSGAYRVPPPLLTHSVQEDVVLIDKVIGFGEIAISDHRSSTPTFDEISRIVGDTRVAGMLSGKCGKTHFHVGSGKSKLSVLWDIVHETSIPISQMYPTHVAGRGEALIEDAKKWLRAGGTVDITCDESPDSDCITTLLNFDKEELPLSQVTLSSDAYGSLPEFDSKGNLIRYDYGRPDVLIKTIKTLVKGGWPLEKALPLATKNTGDYLKINKGVLAPLRDADIVVINDEFAVQYVFSKGQVLKTPTWSKKSLFGIQ